MIIIQDYLINPKMITFIETKRLGGVLELIIHFPNTSLTIPYKASERNIRDNDLTTLEENS